jgi:hypothetical protein
VPDTVHALEWLHARYNNFPNDPSCVPAPAAGNDLITINGAGFHMVNAPDFSAYGAANYTMAVAGGMGPSGMERAGS